MRIARIVAALLPVWLATLLPAQGIPDFQQPQNLTFTRYTDTNLPPRIDIDLQRPMMFAPLPAEISSVYQAPDARIWLRISYPLATISHTGLQELIRREFPEKMPQIAFARPILFEPGGRVWFVSDNLIDENGGYTPALLIGYDGKDFVERQLSRDRSIGLPPMSNFGGIPYLAAAGCAFFATSDTLYVYDGNQWSTREVASDRFANGTYRFYAEPDGKGVLALPRDRTASVIRWRSGQWNKLDSPAPVESSDSFGNRVANLAAAPRSDGFWLLTGEGLNFYPYDSAGTQPAKPLTVPQLIAQLRDPDFDTRELATHRLLARGKTIESDLRKALDDAAKDESKYRLEYLLNALSTAPRPALASRSLQFGNYRLSSVALLQTLPTGATLVCGRLASPSDGKSISNFPAEFPRDTQFPSSIDVVLIQEPNGQVHPLGGADLLPIFHNVRITAPDSLLVQTDNTLWVRGDSHPTLIDLATGKILHTIPLWDIDMLLAATADGTVFFNARGHVFVYHPDGKDSRLSLQPSQSARYANLGVLTGDGAYWFTQPGERGVQTIARFDGTNLQVIPGSISFGTPHPGHDGILLEGPKSWTLVTPRGSCTDQLLEDLIARNPLEVGKAFWGSRPISSIRDDTHVQTDGNGNIWLLRKQTHELKAFADGKWLEATDALVNAGDLTGKATVILPVGESKMILVANFNRDLRAPRDILAPNDKSKNLFLVSIQNGKVNAEALPESLPVFGLRDVVYSSGDPWISVTSDNPQEPNGYATCRMTSVGSAETVAAIVLAADSDGTLLVAGGRGEPGDMKLYRAAKFVDLHASPALSSRDSKIAFVSPGKLCYFSALGLHFDDVKDPKNSVTYNLALDSRPTLHEISPLGFAAVIVPTSSHQPSSPNLFFFPLKKTP